MLVLRQRYFSGKDKYSEEDFKKASNKSYLTSLTGLIAGGVLPTFAGQYIGNQELKKRLLKGEDFDEAEKKAKNKAKLIGGLAGVGAGILSAQHAKKILGCKNNKWLVPVNAAIDGLAAAGIASWGTGLRAKSLKKNKENK